MISEIEVTEPDSKTGTLNLLSSQALLAIRLVFSEVKTITWSSYYNAGLDWSLTTQLTPVLSRSVFRNDASFKPPAHGLIFSAAVSMFSFSLTSPSPSLPSPPARLTPSLPTVVKLRQSMISSRLLCCPAGSSWLFTPQLPSLPCLLRNNKESGVLQTFQSVLPRLASCQLNVISSVFCQQKVRQSIATLLISLLCCGLCLPVLCVCCTEPKYV